jgi:hypothetical protein
MAESAIKPREPAACFSPGTSARSLDGGMCLVPEPIPPAPSTSADGGVCSPPASADVVRALGYLAEDPPASFEKELPFGGLGIGLEGGPNGIGRDVPGLGNTTIAPGKKPPPLDEELVRRREGVPDNPTISKRPVDEPHTGGRTTFRAELPDGGVTRR